MPSLPTKRENVAEQYTRFIGVDPEKVFADALEKVHGSGGAGRVGSDGQYTARCPAEDHRDTTPSLHWFVTENHQVKFNCFAGCEGDAVMRGLGLRWHQLRPVKMEFDYFDRQGEYLFTVERLNKADGSKTFRQKRKLVSADGERTEEDGNGLTDPDVESVLWLDPELESWKEDHRSRGTSGTLWLVEGEKDTLAVVGAMGADDGDFVTTAPQGAQAWKLAHTRRVGELVSAGVVAGLVIVCDPDGAGLKRGHVLRGELEAESWAKDLPIAVVAPEAGADVADLCDQYGARWVEQLEDVDESDLTLLIEEGSAASGAVRRMPLGRGARPGRMGMAAVLSDDKIALVIAGEIRPVRWWEAGWIVEVIDPHDEEPREVVLERRDMMSKSAFDRWLVGVAHLSPVPKNGVGTGEFALQLQAYLKWYCRVKSVPRICVTSYLTWVDKETGEPAKLVGEDGLTDSRVVWVGGDQEADGEVGVRWIGTDHAGSGWGKKGTELDAAWAWARALTMGDEATVATVAGWVGAMLASPWLGKWMPTKPGLAVIAPSGSGKTHGAPRMLLQLAGCNGNMTASTAGLRRRLAAGGVANIQWVDDSGMLDDHAFKEVLRVATSQGDHVLANADAGTRVTDGAKLTGCVVVSAEGVSWLDEVAMQDRFVRVRPENPQNRLSVMRGREGELQWQDVQELMAEGDIGGGTGLTVYAGWTVEGIRRVVEGEEGRARVAQWVSEIGRPKGRNDVGPFVAALGLRTVLTWLYGVKGRAGASWPGLGEKAELNGWKWLVEACDGSLEGTRAEGPAMPTLVSTVLPTAMLEAQRQVRGPGVTGIVVSGVDGTSEAGMRESLQRAVRLSNGVQSAMPAILVDVEGRIWVWIDALASWYAKEKGRSGGAEVRIAGVGALRDQLTTVEDNPEWAHHQVTKSGGRKYVKEGVRMGARGMSRAVYRRLSEEASRVVMGE